MKCLLCKGRGGFLVFKENNAFNADLGGTDYYINEPCHRCNGTGMEKYIGPRRRMASLMISYGESYKYFKLNNTEPTHKEIIEYLK